MNWAEFKGGFLIGLVAGVIGGFILLLIVLLKKPTPCPQCQKPLPKFRTPGSGNQALKGGCICKACGCKVDRTGKKIDG